MAILGVIVPAILATLLALPAIRFASKRAAHQPFTFPDAERSLLRTFFEHPEFMDDFSSEQLDELSSEGFTVSRYRELLACLRNGNTPTQLALKELVEPTLNQTETTVVVKELVAAAKERDFFAGAGATGLDPNGNVVRLPTPISRKRLSLVPITGALTAGLAYLSPNWFVTAYLTFAVLLLLVLALVDYDTLYLDTPTLWVGGAILTPFVLVDAVLHMDTNIGLLLISAFIVLIFMMFLLAGAYQRIRGVTGLGLGDLSVLPVAALTTSVAARSATLVVLVLLLTFLFRIILPTVEAAIKFSREPLRRPHAMIPYMLAAILPAWILVKAFWLG